MAILPAVIEVEGEEATVEAGHLAANFGLSVDRLRAEMRRGIVYGMVERGVGEDARTAAIDLPPPCALVDRGRRSGRHAERGSDRGPYEVTADNSPHGFVFVSPCGPVIDQDCAALGGVQAERSGRVEEQDRLISVVDVPREVYRAPTRPP